MFAATFIFDPTSKGNQDIVVIPKINYDKSKMSQVLDSYISAVITAYCHDLNQNNSIRI